MGSHYKRAIFNEHVQVGLVGWAEKVKKKKAQKADSSQGSSHDHEGSNSAGIQLGSVFQKRASAPDHEGSNSAGIQLGSVFQKKASAPEDNASASVPKAEGSN